MSFVLQIERLSDDVVVATREVASLDEANGLINKMRGCIGYGYSLINNAGEYVRAGLLAFPSTDATVATRLHNVSIRGER